VTEFLFFLLAYETTITVNRY